jgi:hypothetical protein
MGKESPMSELPTPFDFYLKGSEQLFASKCRTLLPTDAELERERRVIEQK